MTQRRAAHPLLELQELGQSPWHDNISRDLLASGALKRMIREGDITGLTSNPTIFQQAIARSTDYDEALERLVRRGKDAEEIVEALSVRDIRDAADLFLPVYRRTRGADGYVSIEVAPRYAGDTRATIRQARRLWKAVRRPNLMVKIPATAAGIPAIEQCIADGLNINITLIFSLERYDQVMEAYLRGLTRRRAQRKRLGNVASVASFFVSRVDTLVDQQLEQRMKGASPEASRRLRRLLGRAAIANARLAYALFRDKFSTPAFAALAEHGARVQRPLWASTSTKNPSYPDIYYVEALAGPDSVDTLPPATLVAYKDHGRPENRLDGTREAAAAVMQQLAEAGIDMEEVSRKLEGDGVASFARSYDQLVDVVAARREAALLSQEQRARLGKEEARVGAALQLLEKEQFGKRLWRLDPTLWKADDPDQQREIQIRLGWLEVVELMRTKVEVMAAFTAGCRKAGFTHALLCGMGGSSLAPEVLRETFGVADGFLDLAILDSTDPAAVAAADRRSNPARTLYIIASKSGSTTEPNAFFSYFWQRVQAVRRGRAGDNFVAITDPGTAMDRTARRHDFREIFLNPPEIGGRYSALSYFGLLPASLMGIDVGRLLERAAKMIAACGPTIPPARNPGLYLGAVLGALHNAGRDKLTLLAPSKIAGLGYWVEQLIAESTGKEGKGIVPIEGEPSRPSTRYGKDRVFVAFHLGRKKTRGVLPLVRARLPLLELHLTDAYDLGEEFFRWEMATAAAGYLLGINPFDQPNVQESKDNTVRLLAEHAEKGRLPLNPEVLAVDHAALPSALTEHLESCGPGDYVALSCYFAQSKERDKLLSDMRQTIGARRDVATTAGYGPRFLHSTGQLHKGGANTGVFIQFICRDVSDLPVPGQKYSFGTLKAAQAIGDYQALAARGRRLLQIDLGRDVDAGLQAVLALIKQPRRREQKAAGTGSRLRAVR